MEVTSESLYYLYAANEFRSTILDATDSNVFVCTHFHLVEIPSVLILKFGPTNLSMFTPMNCLAITVDLTLPGKSV